MCSVCKAENKISDREIISIQELLESDETTLFKNFPVLTGTKALFDLKCLQRLSHDLLSQ